mmetsp:Transcript_3609/g.7973  ORF Transcript_3609/g.7973 Transcript_3609/m.7973 type:complete len:188 (-) Transcript_3609:319-882(-)
MWCCETSTRSLSKRWAPLVKTAVASVGDIYGDWVFYQSIALRETDSDIVDTYKLPILVFFVVACVMFTLTLFYLLHKGCSPQPRNIEQNNIRAQQQQQQRDGVHKTSSSSWFSYLMGHVNTVLVLEILLEDIPQFVLSALVHYAQGQKMTPAVLLNITTSAYNFVFNILDIIDPGDDEGAGEEGLPL